MTILIEKEDDATAKQDSVIIDKVAELVGQKGVSMPEVSNECLEAVDDISGGCLK